MTLLSLGNRLARHLTGAKVMSDDKQAANEQQRSIP
jgi:hypothetical protein